MGVEFSPLRVEFWLLGLYLGLSKYILSLWESFDFWELILGLNELILGVEGRFWAFENHFRPLKVNFGKLESILCL